MDSRNFTKQELSKRLTDLGLVSEFDYYWCGNKLMQSYQWAKEESTGRYSNLDEHGCCQQAIHFSDLMLPENAYKIWKGPQEYYDEYNIYEWEYKTECLLHEMQTAGWQEWLTQELDRMSK